MFVHVTHREVRGDRAGRLVSCAARIEAPADRPLEAAGTVTLRLHHGDEVVREVPRAIDVQLDPGERAELSSNDEHRVHALEARPVTCTAHFHPA